MSTTRRQPILGAIDVGSNAVRLELARPHADGSLETLHYERDPVRPGEGVFDRGEMSDRVANRLIATLKRYAALCRRYEARVRAVATSALRDARNRHDVIRRVHNEAGLSLEVVSGREEARLICLGVLYGRPAGEKALVIDIGGGSTEVASAIGSRPERLWSIPLGAVRLTEMFSTSKKVGSKKLKLTRAFVQQAIAEELPKGIVGITKKAFGSSGTIKAIITFAAAPGTGHVNAAQLTEAVEQLVALSPSERRQRFDSRRADIVVAGAVILEAVAQRLNLSSITAVEQGLRNGLLVDLMERNELLRERELADEAVAVGRRFGFEEPHGQQVARIAMQIFDALQPVHKLPSRSRSLLEASALLHDIGMAVSLQRHHKHTFYLIQNTEITGLDNRERDIVARTARFHRRSLPEKKHPALDGLSGSDVKQIRALVAILRVADALDLSHHQLVKQLDVEVTNKKVTLALGSGGEALDLELWGARRETRLFEKVFKRQLEIARAKS